MKVFSLTKSEIILKSCLNLFLMTMKYPYWQSTDKKVLKKINTLIKDIKRNPFEGMGKPEPLKYV